MQFKEPSDTGALPTKSADLLRLLSEGQNVVLSHELFKLLNDTAIDRIKEFDYTLFLDEEIEVVELSDITQDDLKILKEQHRKYQNGDRELKEAVTNISHDLRTPLTAISGYLELLEEEEKSETVAQYLSFISGSPIFSISSQERITRRAI